MEILRLILNEPERYSEKRENLATYMERHSWELVINDYDRELEQLGRSFSP